VIRSWLLDLMVRALEADADLSNLRGYAEDSGEGRWTVQAAVDHAVPLPVITASLFARFSSRQEDSPAMKMVAALRNQFGGHAVTSKAGSVEKGADSPGADVDSDSAPDPSQSRERGGAGTPPGA
jgi:6-phosphogluconate dehydrogenase